MLVKDEVLTFVSVRRSQGTSVKTNKEYDMITVTVLDDDYNKLQFTLSDELRDFQQNPPIWMSKIENRGHKIVCTIEFVPSGQFGITAILREFEPLEDT